MRRSRTAVTEDHRFWSVTDDSWVELQDLDPTEGRLDPTRFPRMMEALMGGWNDAHEEEFLLPMVAQLDETWKSDPDGSIRRGKIDRVRAWIEEHPDGVERELLG